MKQVQKEALDIEQHDWLNDSPEQIAEEDALWDAAFARDPQKLRAMVLEAVAEYKVGDTIAI